jgi:cytoplasmic iron level regulating protein YaaA (DUF328/UPF0246 family)
MAPPVTSVLNAVVEESVASRSPTMVRAYKGKMANIAAQNEMISPKRIACVNVLGVYLNRDPSAPRSHEMVALKCNPV